MLPIKLIRNNIISVTFAQIISLLLNILTFAIVARVLSVKDFGTFNYLLAVIGFTSKIIDLGINPIILRETTKNKNYNEYIGSAFILKSSLIILLLLVINFYSFLIDNTFTEKLLLNLFTINIFFSSKYTNIRELLIIPYKVTLKMSTPMLLVLVDSVLLFTLSLLLKPSPKALLYFGVIYVTANIPSTLTLFLLLVKKQRISFSFNKNILRTVLKLALPIYGYVMLMILFAQVDILLLGYFDSEYAVGIYSSAIRLSNPFLIFASAITLTFFPIIVKKIELKENISSTISSILTVLFIVSFSISLFLFFYSKEIVTLVFGSKFIHASEPLQYLSIAIIFMFLNFFIVDVQTAYNKQKINFVYGALINILAIPLYVIFLPRFSDVGAGIIKLISLSIGTVFLMITLSRRIRLEIRFVRLFIWVIVNIALFILLRNVGIIFAVLVEGSSLMFSLILLKVLSYEELKIIFKAFNQEKILKKLRFLG